MGYIQDFDKALALRLDEMLKADSIEEQEQIKAKVLQWAKERILESYRNGLKAKKTEKPEKR